MLMANRSTIRGFVQSSLLALAVVQVACATPLETLAGGGVVITEPNAGTVWRDGDQSVPIRWTGGTGALRIDLYKNGSYVMLLTLERTATDQEHHIGQVRTVAMGSGTGFRVKITDETGQSAFSDAFRIADQLRIRIERRLDGRVALEATGVPGRRYVLERSSALETWTGFISFTLSPAGTWDTVQEIDMSARSWFYRASELGD